MQMPLRQLGPVRDLSRRLYVMSRVGRGVAIRAVYLAYAKTLTDSFSIGRKEAALNLRARMERLFEQDWSDAEKGLYPRALLGNTAWRDYARAMPALLADLPRTRTRIREQRFDDLPEGASENYPRYYARNFHFQTDGYLGHTSAALYDLQVEMLFGGTADAMRRRLIPPIVEYARARAQGGLARGPLRILDVACGTGHLLAQLGAALPQAELTGVESLPALHLPRPRPPPARAEPEPAGRQRRNRSPSAPRASTPSPASTCSTSSPPTSASASSPRWCGC